MAAECVDRDLDLIVQAQSGHRPALDAFVRRNERWLRGVIYSTLGHARGVDDVLQQVWTNVCQQIGTLVYALARRKDLPQFKASLGYLVEKLEYTGRSGFGWEDYQRYYQAQALFQGDVEAWKKWNKLLIRQLKAAQLADGSIPGQHGATVGTSLSLLALALNYRFLPIYER